MTQFDTMADAKPTIFSIPVQRAFADALVAGLLDRHADGALGLAEGLILLPSNRARSAVQAAFVRAGGMGLLMPRLARSEEHTSELQSLMHNSYAVFCLQQ